MNFKIAALLIPKFKMDWVQKEDEQQEIIEQLKICLQPFCDEDKPEDINIANTNVCGDNFYIFKRKKANVAHCNC
jgi:hypothetical protein